MQNHTIEMRYLHTLDPYEVDQETSWEDDYWESVAELEAEDKAMEKYYEEQYL